MIERVISAMTIISGNGKRFIDVGTSDVFYSLRSTVEILLKNDKDIGKARAFLRTGKCLPDEAWETARQFNLIRDKLSRFAPDQFVYDIDHPQMDAPWKEQLSTVITSCGNLFITADGKDLLYEIVSILCYAHVVKSNVEMMS